MRIREIRKAESGKRKKDGVRGRKLGGQRSTFWGSEVGFLGVRGRKLGGQRSKKMQCGRLGKASVPEVGFGDARAGAGASQPGFKAWIKKTNPLPGEEGGWLGKVRVTISGSGGGGRGGRGCQSRAARRKRARGRWRGRLHGRLYWQRQLQAAQVSCC